MKEETKPLTVYKASAGSGKTFRLAVEYIKLVVREPHDYRSILAVTFTNKATAEMKERILSQLYGIWKLLPDSTPYMETVCKELGCTEEYASRQAGVALRLLLHDYGRLKVTTIDKFFQSVMKNLARELDLTPNLMLDLNDEEAKDRAVDEMIESFDRKSPELGWIMGYIDENLKDDKRWNVVYEIKKLADKIFSTPYKQWGKTLNEVMADKQQLAHFKSKLREMARRPEVEMKDYVESFFDAMSEEGLGCGDLSYKDKGVWGYFSKMKGGTFDDSIFNSYVNRCYESADAWASKSNKRRDEVVGAAEQSLQQILVAAETKRREIWKPALSARVTLANLNALQLLDSIDRKLRTMNEEANRFQLSDTQHLLHDMIDESDSPFIFERLGSQLEHVMIDEFQDTSRVQWENFKVLLNEIMSHNDASNLIVGDVKQSIYRFRDGNWRILNNIEREFANAEQMIDSEHLKVNRRSERNVIEFNNEFFRCAADINAAEQGVENPDGAAQIETAYSDVEQNTPEGRTANGLIEVTLLGNDDYQELTLQKTAETVARILDEGVPQNRVAILARTNDQLQEIADYFRREMPQVKLVSNEAFRFDSSNAVRLIVAALRFIADPDDHLALATFAAEYQTTIMGRDLHVIDRHNDYTQMLPEDFITRREELLAMPLYDLIEELHRILTIDKIEGEGAFLCAFYDKAADFIADRQATINDLLKEWDEHLYKKTIQTDLSNGLPILTIHKSKGLEYDNVIIPFCDWDFNKQQRHAIWCHTDEESFSLLPIIPIWYSAELANSVYREDYLEEKLQISMDNLNALYVAFTRAGRNLFVIGQMPGKDSPGSILAKVMIQIMKLDTKKKGKDKEASQEPISFTRGTFSKDDGSDDKTTKNVFLQPITQQYIQVKTFARKADFKQSRQSQSFTQGDNETETTDYIQLGTVLHQLFSAIKTTDDIEPSLRQLEMSGILDKQHVNRDQLTSLLRKRLNSPQVAEWFSPKWQLFTECDILCNDGDTTITQRPDRVMTDGTQTLVIDYKFGNPAQGHHKQVADYCRLLRKMGMKNVSGRLWYVYRDEIVPVD